MIEADESVTFTADELTWLSASTLIENHYALSESPPPPDPDAITLFQSVFNDSMSEDEIEMDENGSPRKNEEPPTLSVQEPSPITPALSRTSAQGLMRTASTTPGTNSPASSISHGLAENLPTQSGQQLITPPPTPPRPHLYPRYLSHDYPPSPSVSSSTLSSTNRSEWIYRTPKSSSLSRHGSAGPSVSASRNPQLLRSPSISSRTYRDNGTPTRNYKHPYHAAAMPRPSSPVLISSTSQLVETPSLEPVSRSPSISSNAIGLRGAANASVSSLQLQSAIRVSPLKPRLRGSAPPGATSSGSVANAAGGSNTVAPQVLERCPSNTSTMTTNSTSTAIWSMLHGKPGPKAERSRVLKSIPSRSQITSGSPVTPTFIAPSPSLSSISTGILIPPKTPPKDRRATSDVPPTFPQKHKDRTLHRRDKFASVPPLPIPTVGVSATTTTQSSSWSSISGMNNSSNLSSSMTSMGASTSASSRSGGSNSTAKARSRNPRDRTPSLTSQCSNITTQTAATTETMSSSCSSRSHPDTPITPLPTSISAPGVYSYRNSSTSSTNTPHSYLHGLGGERGILQYRHQRKTSTSSSINIMGGGTAAASAARSQAYEQLTRKGSTTRPRRPSTAPGSDTSSIRSIPYLQQSGLGGIGSGVRYGNVNGHDTSAMSSASHSPSTPYSSSSTPHPHNLSSISLSHYGNSYVSHSSHAPLTPHAPHHYPSKAKSILTRTSSISTKGSAHGGTVKSVKFVEKPEVYYRSAYYEQDGKEYIDGREAGNDTHSYGNIDDDDDDDDGDGGLSVGAKGEGREGKVLKEYMGIDVGAIDMDINTYLGSGVEEEVKEEEVKTPCKRKQGLGWNFLLKGWKEDKDKETRKGDDENSCPAPVKEQKKTEEEKGEEKTSSGLSLKRLMGIGRKIPPPSLSLSISSPFPLGLRSTANGDTDANRNNKKQSTSPPVSPCKPAISGPYVLGSHLPSRSPPSQSPIPSPSASLLHHTTMPTRSIPTSPSNTSLSRLNNQSKRHYHQYQPSSVVASGSTSHYTRSMQEKYRSSNPATAANGIGMNMERPIGPNVAGTRPKGIIGSGVLDLTAVPLKNAPSYESFRSTQSYGGRSEAGSVKSARSAGGASVRSFKTWMSKAGGGFGNGGVTVAIAE